MEFRTPVTGLRRELTRCISLNTNALQVMLEVTGSSSIVVFDSVMMTTVVYDLREPHKLF